MPEIWVPQEPGIKRHDACDDGGFFQNDSRLAAIFAREQNAFTNYLASVTLWSVEKDKSLDAAMTDYERLGAADTSFKPDSILQSPEDKN
ncbi:hypothetical protein [Mesorhizobium sp. M0220]|uniref:hypothetical protein n=1 Tax=unclassified Mesorhizobium TaxID=325217 RepID=UPI00333DACB9